MQGTFNEGKNVLLVSHIDSKMDINNSGKGGNNGKSNLKKQQIILNSDLTQEGKDKSKINNE